MSDIKTSLTEKDRKNMEKYVAENINKLTKENKINIFNNIYLSCPNSLTDASHIYKYGAIKLDPKMIPDNDLIFLFSSVEKFINN